MFIFIFLAQNFLDRANQRLYGNERVFEAQSIEDLRAFFDRLHDFGIFEDFEMVRDGWARENRLSREVGYIDSGKPCLRQIKADFLANRVAEREENRGAFLEFFGRLL